MLLLFLLKEVIIEPTFGTYAKLIHIMNNSNLEEICGLL